MWKQQGKSAPDDAALGPAQAAPDLGPFDPPANYSFEPELRGPPPRPVPSELRSGRYAQRRRRVIAGSLVAGALCVGLGLLPIVKFWGLFLLPLGYLSWIGVGLILWAMAVYGGGFVRKGPYRYVEDGTAVVARVCAVVLRPMVLVHGQPASYRFTAIVQYRDPATGNVATAETSSNDINASAKDKVTTSFRVGDYVTAVYLDSDPQKTLRLYGFLDLKPGVGVIDRERTREASLLKTIAAILVGFGFFAVLLWNVYALERYQPLHGSVAAFAPPAAAGGILLGGLMLWFIWRSAAEQRKKAAERNAQAAATGQPLELQPAKRGWFGSHGAILGLVIVAGSLLLGGVTMVCWCFTANAILDRSPPQFKPVVITDMIMETHSFLIRNYQIKYRMVDNDDKHSLLSTPDEMQEFQNNFGIAEIHAGRLGWPWVKSIAPVVIAQQQPGP
ncbi:MAG: DUF3592 domain-containing protein [Planctomycetia bacterium]|nr:DUF3592 domain-containing protein [Planctomycetia bacterium]